MMNTSHFSKLPTLALLSTLALFGASCTPAEKPADGTASVPTPVTEAAPSPTNQPTAPAPKPTTSTNTVPAGTTSRTLTMRPVGDSKVSGTVTFTKVKEGLRVSISLKNADPGKSHSANIESGTCAQRGELRYALSNVIKGYSVTILNDLGFEHIFNKDKVLSVKVKPSNESLYSACADVK